MSKPSSRPTTGASTSYRGTTPGTEIAVTGTNKGLNRLVQSSDLSPGKEVITNGRYDSRFLAKASVTGDLYYAARAVPAIPRTGTSSHPLGDMLTERAAPPFAIDHDDDTVSHLQKFLLQDKIQKLHGAFKAVDPRGAGTITKQQFRDALYMIDKFACDREINDLWKKLDKARKGSVGYSDFLTEYGEEFMKKKALRHGDVTSGDITSHVVEQSSKGTKERRKLPAPGKTKAMAVRTDEVQRKADVFDASQKLGPVGLYKMKRFMKTQSKVYQADGYTGASSEACSSRNPVRQQTPRQAHSAASSAAAARLKAAQ